MSYVALMMPEKMGGGIYGVAKCETRKEEQLVMDWAKRNNVPVIIGSLASPDSLLHDAAISYPKRTSAQ